MKTEYRISKKFDVPSIYIDGKYYFPQDIKENKRKGETNQIRCNIKLGDVNDKPYSIEVVYYNGKWFQDTHYITEKMKIFLEGVKL